MKIQSIPIDKITPDLNQPRKIFNEKDIQELAESIKQENLINPIEIDPQFVIILGERRFRAAKLAGLTTIPATIRKIFPRERFLRQLVENLHTGNGATMVAIDIANAFAKILDDMEEGRSVKNKQWLAEKIGKNIQNITNMLHLLEEKGDVKKYLETPNAQSSFIREANKAPMTRIADKLKEKIFITVLRKNLYMH